LDSENCYGSAIKGGSLFVKDVFAKKFLVAGEIPLSALAPARRAAAASEPKAPPSPANGQSTPWSTAMLAESYLLKLEAAVRSAKEAATMAATSRLVSVTLPADKAS
jgi:hypothetical protein